MDGKVLEGNYKENNGHLKVQFLNNNAMTS